MKQICLWRKGLQHLCQLINGTRHYVNGEMIRNICFNGKSVCNICVNEEMVCNIFSKLGKLSATFRSFGK